MLENLLDINFSGKRGSTAEDYIIYENYVVVLIIAYSDKKTQRATIDMIKNAFEMYKKEVYDRFGRK